MRSKFFQNSLVELIDVDVIAAIFVLNNETGGVVGILHGILL